MTLLLNLLTVYGIVFFLQQKAGWLTEPVTSRVALAETLLHCTFCTGFWCGMLYAVAATVVEGTVYTSPLHAHLFGVGSFGFASAAFCYGIDAAIQRLERE